MPWTPSDAKKKYKGLSSKQTEIWAKVANASLDAGDDEATAIKKANAAVNRMRKKEAQSEAALVLVEVGRMISTANMAKIMSAMKSMKDAIATIEPLMNTDSSESNVLVDIEQDPENVKLHEVAMNWGAPELLEAAKILAKDDSYDAIRYSVAQALRKRALTNSLSQKLADNVLYDDYYYGYSSTPYIRDLYDGYVVYTYDNTLYQCEYTITDSEVTLGDETEVQVSYVPVATTNTNESKIIEGDLISLQEKAVKDDGTVRIKLISPGWGSSGYYSKEMLKRDGSKVFKAGTHMYMNHPTEQEARERPERDVRDLVGALITDAQWEDANNNNTGEGLYANARVYDQYRSFVNEAAPDIGVSIRASGVAKEGEAEKRHGLIIGALHEGFSVDYVTLPGRGGQVLSLFESARANKATHNVVETQTKPVEVPKVAVEITEEQLKTLTEAASLAATFEAQLKESNRTIARLQESMTLSNARDIVNSIVNQSKLHTISRSRVVAECLRDLPLTDGVLDEAKLRENTENHIKEELTYLESVGSHVTGGNVVGMGTAPTANITAEEIQKGLTEEFQRFGINEKGAAIAARGRS